MSKWKAKRSERERDRRRKYEIARLEFDCSIYKLHMYIVNNVANIVICGQPELPWGARNIDSANKNKCFTIIIKVNMNNTNILMNICN